MSSKLDSAGREFRYCIAAKEAIMNVAKIPTGHAPPSDINVVIEIPQGSGVKYEVDKRLGRAHRGPVPVHADGLSGGLWLHPRHARR